MLIAGNYTLTNSLYFVTADAGDNTNLLIDGASLIGQSADAKTSQSSVDTSSTGTHDFGKWHFTVPKVDLAGDVFIRLKWEVTSASSGDSGRINVELHQNGSQISGSSTVNGPARSLGSTGTFEELLHVQLPNTTFSAGDTFEILIQLEITDSSGGGSTVDVDFHHDPTTISGDTLNEAAIAEVNL